MDRTQAVQLSVAADTPIGYSRELLAKPRCLAVGSRALLRAAANPFPLSPIRPGLQCTLKFGPQEILSICSLETRA